MPDRFDLTTLEIHAVRELLMERLTTALGRPLVEGLGPLPDPDAANAALGVAAALAAAARDGEVPPVGGVVEVRSWLVPFFEGQHQPVPRDVAHLKRALRGAARCGAWLGNRAAPELVAFGERFPKVADLAAELEHVVDDRGEVLSSASVRLADARREIEAAEAAVRSAIANFVQDERMRRCLQSPEPSWRHGRPVFQVRQELRRQVPGVLHDRSQSGATVFVEPEIVVEAANRLADARAAEHREIQVVLTDVCRALRRWRREIELAVEALAELDLAMACARLITEDGFEAAPVVPDGPLRLRGALHPILLRAAHARGRTSELVPLDVDLGEPHRMLVVTGPNTGGKTVVLKTIGLLSVMALSGVPVPARRGTQVPFWDGVFADIGDEQGIDQNLSTFSSHVTRIGRCLAAATDRSLVLLDELGAGTDPEEGGALGYAVLEELARRRTCAVVTTHLGRLKEFAYRHREAENGSMAFDGASLRPLYRLDVGIPGASHALDIAGRVGLPEAVVERARALLGRRDQRLEQVIEEVQRARREAEAERRRTENLKRAAEVESDQLREKRLDVERRGAWLEEEADALVEEELRRVRARLEAPLKRLANAPRGLQEAVDELRGVAASLEEGTSLRRRRLRFAGAARKGTVVWLPRLGKRCVVKKVDRVRELLTLEVGNLRLEVPYEEVSWLQPLDG